MKKLKIIIIISIIAIIVIVGTILFLKIREGDVPEIAEIEEISHAGEEEENSDMVKDATKFFTVASCISQYLDIINENSSIYYGYNENNEYTKIMDPQENIQEILTNPDKKVELLEEKVKFIPLQMRMIANENTEKYLVYGMIQNLDNEYKGDIYTYVTLCPENATFSIDPIEEEIKDIKKINFTNEGQIIEEKVSNLYEEVEVDNEYLCKQYFDIYKSLSLAKPEKAYELLEEEYKKQRFGNLETYQKYISDNREELEGLRLTQYLVNDNEEYMQYVCKNQYDNLVIFDETALMNVKIKLDTYTIPTDKFKTTYNSTNNQKRVMMNIDKWVQMLNNRDYKVAYEVLNETFRNNTFGSEEKFEAYMKENYPDHYKIEFSTYSDEDATHVYKIKLKDVIEEKEEEKELEIIMRLEEGIDFVMSFN